ncbi:sortase [Candidatus Peregrinibacteria bacterium]|jgi:LPXTG-site transpeptidase (sortase) family protein|nr:sortase [Candidatus Peregrinibacteria bacterium]MBT7483241.1 sortase [Candidatus Peregrinibacteria bacterium]MBT7702996.1 sortase [Candidatus Peregrinibacteria bacterium]
MQDYYVIPELEAERDTRSKGSFVKDLTSQIGWMTIFSLMIFTIGFFTINAEAYSEIMMTWASKDWAQAQEQAMSEVVAEQVVEQRTLVVRSTPETQKSLIPDLNLDITPPDNRLIIPKIGKNIPIVTTDPEKLIGADWKTLEQAFQEDLKNGVIHYPGTADPGEVGNVFITGHSSYYLWDSGDYKDVFARLNKLEIGDEIVVYHDQDEYRYMVREMREVRNEDVSVLDQSNEKTLTLMTCSPVGTNFRRLVVVADQI